MAAESNEPTSKLPFEDLRIDKHVLDVFCQERRQLCSKCNSRYLLYCYTCFVPLHDLALKPELNLPLSIEIIRHPRELLSKATGVHAAVLCPEQVTIHQYPEMPEFDPEDTVLLFPSKEAVPVSELSDQQLARIKHAVFIDSTWQQARSIWTDPRVDRLPKICIPSQRTLFWRYHHLGDQCLSTIEAIYHCCREWHLRRDGNYSGQVDNLLLYFVFQYYLIQSKYRESGRPFQHKQNYLLDESKHIGLHFPSSSSTSSAVSASSSHMLQPSNSDRLNADEVSNAMATLNLDAPKTYMS